MNKQLELQLKFQLLAGQNKFGIDEIPDIETRELRLKLALEELCELAEAFGLSKTFGAIMQSKIKDTFITNETYDTNEYNQVEVFDALIDIAVINNGTIITCGFEDIFDREYKNVDTNNKTKFHEDYWEAVETQKYYKNHDIFTTIVKIVNNDFWYYVVKNEYGKVLKPYNYEPVKLNLNKNA